jgi:hypothetical protein
MSKNKCRSPIAGCRSNVCLWQILLQKSAISVAGLAEFQTVSDDDLLRGSGKHPTGEALTPALARPDTHLPVVEVERQILQAVAGSAR